MFEISHDILRIKLLTALRDGRSFTMLCSILDNTAKGLLCLFGRVLFQLPFLDLVLVGRFSNAKAHVKAFFAGYVGNK